MKFSATDREMYPKLYNYIRYSIPKIATVGVTAFSISIDYFI